MIVALREPDPRSNKLRLLMMADAKDWALRNRVEDLKVVSRVRKKKAEKQPCEVERLDKYTPEDFHLDLESLIGQYGFKRVFDGV